MRAETFRKRIHQEMSNIFRVKEPLVVYKKIVTRTKSDEYRMAIAVLEIPAGARINIPASSACSRFCLCSSRIISGKLRASRAKVLKITSIDGKQTFKDGQSSYSPSFKYWKGKVCRPSEKFDTASDECASGIHFFRTRAEAVSY